MASELKCVGVEMKSLQQLAWDAYVFTFPTSIQPWQVLVPKSELPQVVEAAEHRRELWWLNAI